jgi:hypothetical protein
MIIRSYQMHPDIIKKKALLIASRVYKTKHPFHKGKLGQTKRAGKMGQPLLLLFHIRIQYNSKK